MPDDSGTGGPSPSPQPSDEPARPTRAARPDWRTLHLWQIQPVRDALVVLGIVGLIALGKALSVVTVPMLLALALAYLFEPVVRRLTRVSWISRTGAAAAIIVVAAVVVVVPVGLGVSFGVVQGISAAKNVATHGENLLTVVRFANEATAADPASIVVDRRTSPPTVTFGPPAGVADGEGRARAAEDAYRRLPRALWRWSALSAIEHALARGVPPATQEGDAPPSDEVMQATRTVTASYLVIELAAEWARTNFGAIGRGALGRGVDAVAAALRTITSIGVLVFMGFLTALFFFFFSASFGRVTEFWHSLIPDRRRSRALDLLGRMDRVIAAFIRGRLTICAIQSAFFTIAYWVIGAPMPLILGPVVGILCLVPFVAMVGVPLSIGLMLLEPSGVAWQTRWWWVVGAPIAVYAIGQALDDYILTPTIQGRSTNLDMPTIVFASIAGGALAGVYGLLLAIPVAACAKILIQEVFWPRFRAWAEGRARDILPIGDDDAPASGYTPPPRSRP